MVWAGHAVAKGEQQKLTFTKKQAKSKGGVMKSGTLLYTCCPSDGKLRVHKVINDDGHLLCVNWKSEANEKFRIHKSAVGDWIFLTEREALEYRKLEVTKTKRYLRKMIAEHEQAIATLVEESANITKRLEQL